MLSVGIGSLQPGSPSPLWKPLPHLQSMGSSVLSRTPFSSNLDPSLAPHEGSGKAGVNVPNQWGQTPARGAVQRMYSTSQPPASSVAQALTAPRHFLSIPPSAAAFAGLQAFSFTAQPVPPLPSRLIVFETEEEMQMQKLQMRDFRPR